MVARNPLFSGRWTLKRFQATVINDIWPEVAFFSLVATMVALVSNKTPHSLSIPTTLLTVLGTVLGLVISFRTSSAYERYQDGRKMWTNIMTASRNLGQMIWIHVPNSRESTQRPELMHIIEKKTMINLIHAFSVAVKHFLRGEEGIYYEDLYPLVCFLPRYASQIASSEDELPLWLDRLPFPTSSLEKTSTGGHKSSHSTDSTRRRRDGFDPEKVLSNVESERPLRPARDPPVATIYDYIPLLRFAKWVVRHLLRRAQPGERKYRKKSSTSVVESHVPLEILLQLNNYSNYLMMSGLLQPAIATGITNNISLLSDTLSNLERICNTPLPFAYQAHLRMSLWLYLFFLPFQIFEQFQYLTIPGTAFAAFLLLGFLEIGQEIENPFNYDLNDLDLDYFCFALQRELHQITAYAVVNPTEFVHTSLNQPFAPSDRRTADVLLNSTGQYETPDHSATPGAPSIRRTLVRGWREVNSMSRS